MFRLIAFTALTLSTAAVHAQVGYNSYANYESWQNS